jgi:hypothetical protein
VQAVRDGHRLTQNARNKGFFAFITKLNGVHGIIAYEDSERWFRNGSKPEKAGNFEWKIQGVARHKAAPAQKMSPAQETLTHKGAKNRQKTAGKNTGQSFQPVPATAKFAGHRDDKGNLKSSKPADVSKSRRRGGRGGTKKKAKNKAKKDDGDDGPGAASGFSNEAGIGTGTSNGTSPAG